MANIERTANTLFLKDGATTLTLDKTVGKAIIINLKTAKALGLTIPPSLLEPADEVIE